MSLENYALGFLFSGVFLVGLWGLYILPRVTFSTKRRRHKHVYSFYRRRPRQRQGRQRRH